jgi:hypothetical protein
MTHLHRFIIAIAAAALASPWPAGAQVVERPVTVNAAVEIPGAVLQAGEYSFTRTTAGEDRVLIRVYDQRDDARVIATMLGVQADAELAAAGALIPFERAEANGPAPVRYWVDTNGPRTYELVYTKDRAMAIAQMTGAPVLSADAPDAGALASATVTAVVDPSRSDNEGTTSVTPTARRGTTQPPPPNVAAPVGGETNPTGTTPQTGTPTSRTVTEPTPNAAQAPASAPSGTSAASSNPTTGEPAPTPAVTDPDPQLTERSTTPDVPNTTTHPGFPNSTAPIRRDEPRPPAADATTGYQRDQNLPATPAAAAPAQTTRDGRPVAPPERDDRSAAPVRPSQTTARRDGVSPEPSTAPTTPAPATPSGPVDPSDPATRRNSPSGVGLENEPRSRETAQRGAAGRADARDMPTRTPIAPAQQADTLPETSGVDGWVLLGGGMFLVLGLLLRRRRAATASGLG